MKTNKKVIKNKLKKGKFLTKIKEYIVNNLKLCFIIFVILVLLIISLFIINNIKLNTKVITINDTNYTRSDFNIYLYSAKYNYFKNDINNVSKDDLKVIYDKESNITVGEYLKEVTLSDIKTASAINKLASDNNIELTDEELKNLQKEKRKFIKKIGGKKVFKKLLKENKTTNTSYDKMTKTDALYKKIIKKLYSEGTINDLSDEEKTLAKENYKNNYFKIKQIILTTIDVNTGKNLNSTTINQKKTLATSIIQEYKNGVNFDELIRKYSEDSTDKEPPYDIYYKKGELLQEIEEALLNLPNGEVSAPIKTKYAYHIVLKEELDDKKLDEYLDELRENKCINVLKELIDEQKIVYQKAYKKIKMY